MLISRKKIHINGVDNIFPHIRKFLWKEMFWSQSFCLLTTDSVTVDIIKQYLQPQGKKDGK